MPPRNKSRKQKLLNNPPTPTPPKPTKNLKKKLKKNKKPKPNSSSDSDSDNTNPNIETLLEPFSKDALVTLATSLSLSHPSLFSLIKSAADRDISHRKVFVHGLGWDSTRPLLESVFQTYGPIEDLNLVTDRATGKCKGYAFLTYATRKSATKLLKNPKVLVGNRIASCQLASEGPAAAQGAAVAGGIVSQQHFASSDYPMRRVYVRNVPVEARAERLKAFFEQFGEIENGPRGMDPVTGKFKGYAIFVYKSVEGAQRALQEPYKVFEGSQLHCQKATEGKSDKIGYGSASITTALQPVQPQMLAAVAAAQQVQSMALLGQQAGFVNPLYGGGMIGNANYGALMGGYYGMMRGHVQGMGLGAYAGVSGDGGSGSSEGMYQGLQYLYPTAQSEKTPSLAKGSGASGSGYSPI